MHSAPRSRRIRARRSGSDPSAEVLLLSSVVQRRLRSLVQALGPSPFSGRRVGVEKESLRVDRAGYISQRPHPPDLGSALTNSQITTDFSEALLEFVTPAYHGVREVARNLRHLHQFTYPRIEDEVLWATSMPCMVTGDRSIPIANYGLSNVGTMKQVYRRGLSHRYGRVMQIISGVHFNFSLPRRFWAAYRELEGRSGEETGCLLLQRVLRAGAQLPSPRMARAVAVRILAGDLPFISRFGVAWLLGAGSRHPV